MSAHAHSKLQEDQHNNQMLVVESRRQAPPNTHFLPLRPSTYPNTITPIEPNTPTLPYPTMDQHNSQMLVVESRRQAKSPRMQ